MKKIAYCLYGQPRNLEKGYKTISKFTENYDVDFYYHTWTLNNENEVYSHSFYRDVSFEELKYDGDIVNKINLLYKPKAYISEVSRTFEYENKEEFENSLIFKNTGFNTDKNTGFNSDKNKISNVFSHYYSKQKVRDLLNDTLEKEKIHYDLVIISRFDMLKEINVDLNLLDNNKVYVSDIHKPRHIISDAILIMNVEKYLKIMNVYNNLKNLLNNHNLSNLTNSYNEIMGFCPENLLFANYLYYFNDLNNLEYINLPNFC
jgi:hypothetical protein